MQFNRNPIPTHKQMQGLRPLHLTTNTHHMLLHREEEEPAASVPVPSAAAADVVVVVVYLVVFGRIPASFSAAPHCTRNFLPI